MLVDFNGDRPRQSVVEGICANAKRSKQAASKLRRVVIVYRFTWELRRTHLSLDHPEPNAVRNPACEAAALLLVFADLG